MADRRRRSAGIALLSALASLTAIAAGAAGAAGAPGLSIEVAAGLGGWYEVGADLPVAVTVDNRGADWSGAIEVGPEPVRLSVPVSLPAPSRKRFAFNLPAMPPVRSLELRLVAAGRTAAAVETPLLPVTAATPLLVAVSEDAPGVPLPPGGDGRLAVVRAHDLPEDWRGWRAADGAILDPAAAAALRQAQARALSDWLLHGGRLALGAPEPAALRRLLLAGAMGPPAVPVAGAGEDRGVAADEPVGGAGEQRWAVGEDLPAAGAGEAQGAVGYRPEAEPAGSDELRWGRGFVRLTGAPAAPLTVARARELLAGRLAVPLAPEDRALLRRAPVDDALRPRPAAPLTISFLLYWLAVAAALTLAARSGRHPLWSLSAVAALAAISTLSLGALGRLAHRGRAPFAAPALIHVFAGAAESFVTARGDLLSMGGRELRLSSRLRDAALEAEDAAGARYRIEPEGATSVALEASLWGRRRIWTEGFAATGLRLEAPPGAAARIVNRSRLALSGCRLLAGGALRPLPDLPPGGSLELPAAEPEPPAAGTVSSGGAGGAPEPDELLARVTAAYRIAEPAEAAVLCSASAGLSVVAAGGPLDERAVPAVVVFHLPGG